MRNIKLTIEYDGKRYSGWQRLGDDDKTIQGKIEKVLHQMTNEEIEIIGSGRNDRLYESLPSAGYCHQKNRRNA